MACRGGRGSPWTERGTQTYAALLLVLAVLDPMPRHGCGPICARLRCAARRRSRVDETGVRHCGGPPIRTECHLVLGRCGGVGRQSPAPEAARDPLGRLQCLPCAGIMCAPGCRAPDRPLLAVSFAAMLLQPREENAAGWAELSVHRSSCSCVHWWPVWRSRVCRCILLWQFATA